MTAASQLCNPKSFPANTSPIAGKLQLVIRVLLMLWPAEDFRVTPVWVMGRRHNTSESLIVTNPPKAEVKSCDVFTFYKVNHQHFQIFEFHSFLTDD